MQYTGWFTEITTDNNRIYCTIESIVSSSIFSGPPCIRGGYRSCESCGQIV